MQGHSDLCEVHQDRLFGRHLEPPGDFPGEFLVFAPAADLLISQRWLHRGDFTDRFITIGPAAFDDRTTACVDWPAAINALDAGDLACSGGEQRMLRLTAGLVDGIPVDLRDALTGIDSTNVQLLVRAVLHASGRRPGSGRR